MICAPTIPQSDPLYRTHMHPQCHTVTSRVLERVTTGLLAKISQDERLHLTDQEGAPDESPTSTRNGAKLLVEDLRLRKGVTRARLGGGTTTRRVLPLVNLSHQPTHHPHLTSNQVSVKLNCRIFHRVLERVQLSGASREDAQEFHNSFH